MGECELRHYSVTEQQKGAAEPSWCHTASQTVFSYPIVHVAVGEHGVEVLYTFKCSPVIFVLKTFVNSAQIHRVCNNCVIILKDKTLA